MKRTRLLFKCWNYKHRVSILRRSTSVLAGKPGEPLSRVSLCEKLSPAVAH